MIQRVIDDPSRADLQRRLAAVIMCLLRHECSLYFVHDPETLDDYYGETIDGATTLLRLARQLLGPRRFCGGPADRLLVCVFCAEVSRMLHNAQCYYVGDYLLHRSVNDLRRLLCALLCDWVFDEAAPAPADLLSSPTASLDAAALVAKMPSGLVLDEVLPFPRPHGVLATARALRSPSAPRLPPSLRALDAQSRGDAPALAAALRALGAPCGVAPPAPPGAAHAASRPWGAGAGTPRSLDALVNKNLRRVLDEDADAVLLHGAAVALAARGGVASLGVGAVVAVMHALCRAALQQPAVAAQLQRRAARGGALRRLGARGAARLRAIGEGLRAVGGDAALEDFVRDSGVRRSLVEPEEAEEEEEEDEEEEDEEEEGKGRREEEGARKRRRPRQKALSYVRNGLLDAEAEARGLREAAMEKVLIEQRLIAARQVNFNGQKAARRAELSAGGAVELRPPPLTTVAELPRTLREQLQLESGGATCDYCGLDMRALCSPIVRGLSDPEARSMAFDHAQGLKALCRGRVKRVRVRVKAGDGAAADGAGAGAAAAPPASAAASPDKSAAASPDKSAAGAAAATATDNSAAGSAASPKTDTAGAAAPPKTNTAGAAASRTAPPAAALRRQTAPPPTALRPRPPPPPPPRPFYRRRARRSSR